MTSAQIWLQVLHFIPLRLPQGPAPRLLPHVGLLDSGGGVCVTVQKLVWDPTS